MTLPRARLDTETLLTHAPYVRLLARELVFDPHLARDIEQETLLAALEHAPRECSALRPWLSVLVRNFARRAWRSGARREQRERCSARPESAVSTPAEILESEEMRRALVERVLALNAPLRDALIMRYFDELPPREIARRLEIPVETVNSRLKRGLELLRERLDREHRGDRRAWALAFVRALKVPASGAQIAGAVISSVSGVALMTLPKKVALTVVVLVLVAAGLYLGAPPERDERSESLPRNVAVLATASESQATELSPLARDDTGSQSQSRNEASAPAEGAPAPKAPSPLPRADLAAREWVTFHVVNKGGLPVPGAEIEITGMRRESERSGWYPCRGEQSLGRTAPDGELRLAYPTWVSLDDKTNEITFTVKHPDYVTLRDDGRVVAPTMEVVLEMDSVLVISGWIGSPDQVVTDVRAHFSEKVDVKPEDWLPRRDGRLTTTRVPHGSHVIYLEHESAAHGLCFSAITEFTLATGDTQELHLELRPARSLVGRLDDVVPRPIVDGHVVLALQMPTTTQDHRSYDALLWKFSAAVNEDGSFTIDRVGVGDAQIIALCKGWASKPESRTPATSGAGGEPPVWRDVTLQRVDLRASTDEFVVAMEPTAVLEVELRLPDGLPLEGARIEAVPNACWRVMACERFVEGREWVAMTDARGAARIEDLPAVDCPFSMFHGEFDLPLAVSVGNANPHRYRIGQFDPGSTLRQTYTVERTKGD